MYKVSFPEEKKMKRRKEVYNKVNLNNVQESVLGNQCLFYYNSVLYHKCLLMQTMLLILSVILKAKVMVIMLKVNVGVN